MENKEGPVGAQGAIGSEGPPKGLTRSEIEKMAKHSLGDLCWITALILMLIGAGLCLLVAFF